MIFELSLANTIERLGTLEDCPDGVVDLSATIARINEYKKVVDQERTDTRSAVVRLTAALCEHMQVQLEVSDDETSSIENVCRRLALSILVAHMIRDSHLANRYENPLDAIANILPPRYMQRLELDLKSVPYWVSGPDSAGIIRASIDISGCACLGIAVTYLTEPDEEDEEENDSYIQFDGDEESIPLRRLFRRPDRDECPEPAGPVYPYDDNTWRAWYENHEPPHADDDDEERPL